MLSLNKYAGARPGQSLLPFTPKQLSLFPDKNEVTSCLIELFNWAGKCEQFLLTKGLRIFPMESELRNFHWYDHKQDTKLCWQGKYLYLLKEGLGVWKVRQVVQWDFFLFYSAFYWKLNTFNNNLTFSNSSSHSLEWNHTIIQHHHSYPFCSLMGLMIAKRIALSRTKIRICFLICFKIWMPPAEVQQLLKC